MTKYVDAGEIDLDETPAVLKGGTALHEAAAEQLGHDIADAARENRPR